MTVKCVICKGEEIELREVTEEIKIENDVVLVPVKVLVCKTCRERYYDRQKIVFLEKIKEKLRNKELELKEIGKILSL